LVRVHEAWSSTVLGITIYGEFYLHAW